MTGPQRRHEGRGPYLCGGCLSGGECIDFVIAPNSPRYFERCEQWLVSMIPGSVAFRAVFS